MKSLIVYIALVGAPLVGLLVILRAGERLTPPRSVAGQWRLDDASADALATWCAASPAAQPPTALTVSQSGTYLELELSGRPKISGRLDGDAIAGELALADGASCPGETAELRAHVGSGNRMTATLSATACPACPTLQLAATRRPPPAHD